jgi:hypothetical protein
VGGLQPLAGGLAAVGDEERHDRPVGLEERLHVDQEVLLQRQPLSGSTVTVVPRSFISTLQASRLTPLIRIASEPQMPCAQDRRKVSEPSTFHFT